MADGQVVFEISADGKKAYAAIEDVTKALKKAGKNWESTAQESAESMGDKLASAFKKISVAAVAMKVGKSLLDLGKDALQAASDLQEVQNVVDVTFGDGASKIEAWAKAASDSFGLTELQAKRFTSTMGAMLKSSGLAGDQIIEMSTDLAGLAADMASFYNLDFDTAFQKIRSGIAGETEPLKQLGINLSVANLEAFALQQGLQKSFAEMSSGEKTLLRYQYMMQATADAQGDFARTADESFANMSRKLQTNLASIETSIGKLLINPVQEATGFISDLLASLLPEERQTTVLDEIAGIDLKTDAKIQQIQQVAAQAGELLTQLETINSTSTLSTESDVFKYIQALTGDIGDLGSALTDGSGIPADLKTITDGLNPDVSTKNVTDAVAAITGGVSALDGAMEEGSGIPADLKGITDGLNPAVETGNVTGAIEAITSGIDDLDKKATTTPLPKDLKDLAGELNPKVEGDFAESIITISNGVATLEQRFGNADKIKTNVGKVASAMGELPSDTSKGDALQSVADAANDLNTLTSSAGENLGSVADGANKLQAGKALVWRAMYNVLKDIDGLSGIFNSSAAGNVGALATALSAEAPAADKAAAWETFLDALGSNAGAIKALTGKDAEGAAEWLTAISNALGAAKVDPSNVNAWNDLLGIFASGLSEENKGKFTSELITGLYAMGSQSEYAQGALAALGFSTEEIDTQQKLWLATCKRLVETIPGLSSIINAETGEIQGGTAAVNDYIKAWQEGQTKLALTQASAQKRSAIDAKFAQLPEYELNARIAEKRARDYARTYWDALDKYGISQGSFEWNLPSGRTPKRAEIAHAAKTAGSGKKLDDEFYEIVQQFYELRNAAKEARATVTEQTTAYNEAIAAWEEGQKLIEDMPDGLSGAANAMDGFGESVDMSAEEVEELRGKLTEAADALQAVADYQESVRNETAQAVRSVVNGFNDIVTPATKARSEVESLKDQIEKLNKEGKDTDGLKKQKDAMQDAIPSAQKMQKALESQLEYMRNYKRELIAAQENGVSESILAMLSDGSQESFDYLYALNHKASGAWESTDDAEYVARIKKLNETYEQVQKESESFTSTLTRQKLTVDETFDELVKNAEDKVAALDMSGEASMKVTATMDAIIAALGSKRESVAAEVDAIMAQLGRLTTTQWWGAGISRGFFGTLFKRYSNANGTDYVPYDGYLAVLHQGERIQTAAEADLARRYSYQQPSFDYAAMGGAIGANIGRGNVYLDGKTVGQVISTRQANSYRALERSGWQG